MSNDNDKCQEYQKNMGKRLRKIRKENALSQDDVADALGICTKQYQRYEYGDSAISCEKLSILEESFHFDVRYIVTGKREQIDIDRYVVNMPWKEKRDFFERMARYVLRILYNTKENRQGNRNIYRGVVKNPTIRMKMRNDKRDNEHRMIHCSGCGKFLATCNEVISLNIICPKCRTVTIADLKSGELKTIRDRRKNQV